MKLSFDEWNRNQNVGSSEIEIESIEIAIDYLQLLDGKKRTMLLITPENNDKYIIFGGGDDKFIVNIVVGDDEGFYNLLNEFFINKNDTSEVVTGGQAGIFEKKYIVDFNMAKDALVYFIQNSEPSPYLIWERDF